jgi:hypothetical protein
MKKGLLILLCVPLMTLAQQTSYVPDANFENYLESHDYNGLPCSIGSPNSMGNGIANDSAVLTSAINTVDTLAVQGQNIADLTGIEAFTALTYLDCSDNQLNHIDVSSSLGLLTLKCNFNNLMQLNVSSNTSLLYFECYENQLTSLDISNNIFLTELWCNDNQLTSLDVQGIDLYVLVCDNNQLTVIDNLIDNVSLKHLSCSNNDIAFLPLSALTDLAWISCSNNQLFELDISHQSGLSSFFCWENPSLTCINVNDVATANASLTVWNGQSGNIDPQHYFSINCPPPSAIEEHNTNKELIKIIDVLGRKTKEIKNIPLLYIYSDGSTEKKLIIK